MLDAQTALSRAESVDTLSIKKLIPTLPKVKSGDGVKVCTVYGFVTGLKAAHDDRGVKVKFFGEFLAFEQGGKNVAMRSKAMTFPPAISDIIVSAQVGDGRCVEFGFHVWITGDNSPVGYHYTAERFIGLEAYAPLERLVMRSVDRQGE